MSDNWPHRFSKTGDMELVKGKMSYRNQCIDCKKVWWTHESQPRENCPARNDKREIGRLLG